MYEVTRTSAYVPKLAYVPNLLYVTNLLRDISDPNIGFVTKFNHVAK